MLIRDLESLASPNCERSSRETNFIGGGAGICGLRGCWAKAAAQAEHMTMPCAREIQGWRIGVGISVTEYGVAWTLVCVPGSNSQAEAYAAPGAIFSQGCLRFIPCPRLI